MYTQEEIFAGSVDYVKNKILYCNNNIKMENKELYEFYCDLLKIRHNLLHYCVLISLNKTWEPEETFRTKFKLDDDCELLNKTPDIIFKDIGDDIYYVIDVSITHDTHMHKKIKKEKYLIVCQYISEKYKLDLEFLHINVHYNNSNLEKQINKLEKIQKKKDFNFQFYYSCITIIEEKIKWVSTNIDKEYFENRKK